MSGHTPGPWRRGNACNSIVADEPTGEIGGSDVVEYYGGHLVAESVADRNIPIIVAAPLMRDAIDDISSVMERHARGEVNADFVVGWVRGVLKRLEEQRS